MRRPWISTNLALSADGKISDSAKRPSGWTSKADHERLIALRRAADALMVGHGTLRSDRMTLTVPGLERQPLRCVVSRHGEIDPGHPVFAKPGGDIHILATAGLTDHRDTRATCHQGDLPSFLETLTVTYGVRHLHCEGGGQLIASLAALDLIDEFHATLAGHTIFGGREAPTATGTPGPWLPESRRFEITAFDPRPATGECFVTWRRSGRSQCA
jgi:2,5-diamino-6-(ribosylamino)-4(3H)-pyrimidinone 5'-phosphate reductase